MIILTDIIIGMQPNSGTLDFLNNGRVIIDIFGEDAVSKTSPPTLKIRRLGPITPAVKESDKLPFVQAEVDEVFEVSPNIRSLSIATSVENPSHGSSQVGKLELDVGDMYDLSLSEKNYFFKGVTSERVKLAISFACIYIPPDEEPTNGPPSHAQNQLLLEGYQNGSQRLSEIGDHFLNRFQRSGRQADLEKAVSYYERVAPLIPDGDAAKLRCLDTLGKLSLLRFEQSGDLMDLNKAVGHHERAVDLTADGHANRSSHLNALGQSFLRRFERLGDPTDTDKAIFHHGHAVQLTSDDHANKVDYLANLGNSFLRRFEYSRNLMDINNAISHHGNALFLSTDSHKNRSEYLNNLGGSFLLRSQHSGSLTDLDRAISLLENAVQLTPNGHADKPIRLNNLGSSFLLRFTHLRNRADIDQAISLLESAVRLTSDGRAGRPGYLNNLGNSFWRRFEHLGNVVDIDQAIIRHGGAVGHTPDGHPSKPVRLTNLGNAFASRYEHLGDLTDLNKAISLLENAVDLAPDGHGGKPNHLTDFGRACSRRFEHLGNLVDIDKAIFHHEAAMQLTPDGHANKLRYLTNLGNSYLQRFEWLNDLMDIDKAISYHENAVQLVPDGHALKTGCLNNLGSAFFMRFEHLGDPTDIEKAIPLFEHAVNLTPDGDADKPGRLNNLGSCFLRQFEHSKDMVDLDKATFYREFTLRLTPDGHADKPTYLSNHGNSSLRRFEYLGDLADIDKAISYHERAVRLTPEHHAYKPSHLNNLGTSFALRFQARGDASDLQQAIVSFKASANSTVGPPALMFEAALKWARLPSLNPSESLTAYETAISLLPRVVWLGQSVPNRLNHLTSVGDIATEAAAAAIASGRLNDALEWLEQARSVVWGQLLNLRIPLDDLRKVNSGLADDLVSTSRALENASIHNTTFKAPGTHISLGDTAQAHHRLAEKWDILLKGVRKLPGFEHFLLPKRLSELSKAARSGPVAVINVHKSRSDALILLPDDDDIVHIPLDPTFYDTALALQQVLRGELQAAGMGVRDLRAGRLVRPNSDDQAFTKVLASLWTNFVKPVLDGLAFNTPNISDPPRIWWCPTGPLTFLPIHAAGLYGQSPPRLDISLADFAISSYTPTLTALLKVSPQSTKAYKGLLGVIQSSTPGLSKLPNADKEFEMIKEFNASLNVTSLHGKSATGEHVLKGMEEASWVHFACHAIQDPFSPMESAFCLDDGNLTLSDLIPKSFPNADFAFLSACETATGDKDLPDEAVHLAGGMLAAGYQSVIATMWSIGDNDAPMVASEVYRHLVSGPAGPDSSRAAYALHQAVKRLREKLGTGGTQAFLSWVPYIHVGM